jgi:hypothetical protein
MRIGLAEQTVISALGQAVVLSEQPPVPPKELPARLDEVSGRMRSSLAFLFVVFPALILSPLSSR